MQQAVVAEAGGVAGLLRLLSSNEIPRREAAVDALASLTANNADVIGRVACSEEAIRQLLKLLKSPSAGVRFLAAQCLTNLAPALPCSHDDSQQSAQVHIHLSHA
jgi:HEAT repeat protein